MKPNIELPALFGFPGRKSWTQTIDYSKSLRFTLPDFEIPPRDYSAFVHGCLDMFRKEVLADHEVGSIHELYEKYLSILQNSGVSLENAKQIYAHPSSSNKVTVKAGFGRQVIDENSQAIVQRYEDQLYEASCSLDDVASEGSVTELVGGISLALDKKIPGREGRISDYSLSKKEGDSVFSGCFESVIAATNLHGLEDYSITLRGSISQLVRSSDEVTQVYFLPTIEVRASTLNGPGAFVDRLFELTLRKVEEAYKVINPSVETHQGSFPY